MGWFTDQRNKWQGFLDKLTNDAHIPIAIFIFVVTSGYHFHTGKDLGANYVSTIFALYAFLGGHAAIYQKWPDKDDKNNDGIPDSQQTQQTTDVNVTVAPAPVAPAAAPAAGSDGAKG